MGKVNLLLCFLLLKEQVFKLFFLVPFCSFADRAITRENMSSTPNLEDQVSGSMDGPTSEDRVHGSLGNLKPPLAEFSTAPPSTAVFNTSTLGASTPLSKDLGTEQNTALSYLLTYVTQGVAQTLKKEIDDSVRSAIFGNSRDPGPEWKRPSTGHQ